MENSRKLALALWFGEQLEERGKNLEALDIWRTLVTRERNVYFLCRLGELAATIGLLPEAREAFEQATKIAPAAPQPLNRLGIFFLEQDEPEVAEGYFRNSLNLEKNARIFT